MLLAALLFSPMAIADTVSTTGTLQITADDVRSNDYGSLTVDPAITEAAIGELDAASSIVISAPTGFRFDTGTNCTAVVTGGNLTLVSNSVAPLNFLTIMFTVNTASTDNPATITFSNILLRQDDTSCNPGALVGARGPITVSTLGGALTDATLVDVEVVHGDPFEMVYTGGSVVDTEAGANLLPEITLLDQCGNTVTTDDRLITFTEVGGEPLNGTASKMTTNGVVTWTAGEALNITTAGTNYQLRATAGGAPFGGNTEDSVQFDITPADPFSVEFSTQPANTAAGEDLTPQVSVRDEYGNLVSDQVRTVTLTLEVNPGGDSLHDTTAVATSGGVAVWGAPQSLHLEEAQNGYQLRATCSGAFAPGGSDTIVSAAFNITHNVADHLVFTVQPANTPAGSDLLPQITIQDAYDNTVLDDDRQITLTIDTDPPGPPPTTLNGTAVKATTSGVATWTAVEALNITRAADGFTLEATAGGAALPGGSSVTSAAFNISHLVPDHLAFTTQPADPTDAGADLTPVVKIQDQYDNTVTGWDQNVTLTIQNDPYNPPGPPTLLNGTTVLLTVNGVAQWTGAQGLNIARAGAGFTLLAQAANPGDFNDGLGNDISAAFDIMPADPFSVEFLVQPVDTVAGNDLTPQVRVLDEYNNVVTDQVRTITLTLEVNPGGDTLHDTTALATSAGIAVWGAVQSLHLEEAQNGYRLRATCSGGFAPGGTNFVVSNAFDIDHAAANGLAISGPGDTNAGADLTPTVTIQDQYGNTVGDDDRNITLTIQDDPYNPPGPATPLNGTNVKATSSGVATWGAVEGLNITKAGSGFTLQAQADGAALPGGNTVTSAAFTIDPQPPDRLEFTTHPANPTGAGVDLLPVVKILDQYDNVVTGFDQNITLTIENDPPAPPPTTLNGTTVKATVNGVATWNGGDNLNIQTMAVGYTLKAQAANPGDFNDGQGNDVSDPFEITVGPPDHIAFSPSPPDTAAGSDLLFTVAIQDQYNNTVTGNDRQITITIENDPFNPPGPATTLNGTAVKNTVNGLAPWTAVEGLDITKAAAGFTLRATADGAALPGGNTATSAAFAITNAAADHVIFSAQPANAAAGGDIALAVTLQDQYDNTVTDDDRLITLTIANDPPAPPPTALNGTTSKNTTSGVASWGGAEGLNITEKANGFTLQALVGGAALPGGSTVTSNAFNITHNVADHLTFTTPPPNTVAGNDILLTVTLYDAYDNVVTDDDRQITLSIDNDPPAPPPTALNGAAVKTTSNGVVNWTAVEGLNITTAANGFTLQAAAGGAALPGGSTTSSPAFNITHDVADHVAFSAQPPNTVAGQNILLTVALQDQYDNTVLDDDRQITLTIANDPPAPPPTALNGTAVKMTTGGVAGWAGAEGLNITVADVGFTLQAAAGGAALPGGSTATSAAFNITHDVADHIAFTTQPVDTVAGQDLLPAVTLRDQYDNTVTNDDRLITLTIDNDPAAPPATSLNGTVSKNSTSGVTTWTAVESLDIAAAADGFTLQASAGGAALPGGSTATSAAFNISPEAAGDHLAFTVQPADSAAAAALLPQITIQDQFNNTVTTADCNITLTIENDAGAPPATPLNGTVTLATVNGVITWTGPDGLNIQKVADGYTLRATGDGALADPDVVSAAFNITPANLDHFEVTPSVGSLMVDNPVTLTITALDAYDNLTKGWTTTQVITLSTTPAGTGATLDWASAIPGFVDNGATATIPIGTTFNPVTATVTVDLTNRQAQTATVTAADVATPATGTSGNVTWTSDSLNNFLLEVDTSTPTAGLVATFTLTARDQFDNPIPNYDPAVNISITTGGAITGLVTFAGAGVTDNGDNTATIAQTTLFNPAGQTNFTVSHTKSAEPITFTANEGAATSNGQLVTWRAGALNNFLLQAAPLNPVAAAATTFTLTARDVFNNPILNHDPAADIDITTSGSITGILAFAGGGLTDNGDNTATIAETTVFDGSGQTTFTATHLVSEETIGFAAAEGAPASNEVDVTWQAGGLDNFLLQVNDAGPAANVAANFTLTARDAQNNPIPSYNPVVDLDITAAGVITGNVIFSGAGITDNGDNTATLAETIVFNASGQAAFSVRHTVSGELVTVTADEGGTVSNGVGVTWIPNMPLLLVIESVVPDPPVAGNNFVVNVKVTDLYGNDSNVVGNTDVDLRVSVGSGVLTAGPETIAAGTNTAVFNPVTYDKAEAIVLIVDRTAGDTLVSGSLGPFNVTGASPQKLIIDPPIANQVAGTPFDVTVKVLDSFDNLTTVAADADIILSVFQGGGVLLGTTTGTILNGNSQVTIAGVISEVAQSNLIIRASHDDPFPLDPGDSNTIVIGPAGPQKLSIPTITQPAANIEFDVTVEVLDQYDNLTTATAASNVTLSLATGTGTLTFITPQVQPLNIGDSDLVFTVKYDMAEAGVSVQATDSGVLLPATSAPFSVNANLPVRLDILAIGDPQTAGNPFDITIRSVDSSNNPANVAGDTVVSLSVNAGSGTLSRVGALPLTGTIAASTNSVTITNVLYDTAETGVTLLATVDSGDSLAPDVSNAFDVDADVAVGLRFFQQPINTDLSSPLEVSVEVVDAYDNRVPTAADAVTIELLDPIGCGGTLTGTTTVSAVAGLAEFTLAENVLVTEICTDYQLRASAGGLGTADSSAFIVNAGRNLSVASVDLTAGSTATGLTVTYTVSGSQKVAPFLIAYGRDRNAANGLQIETVFGYLDVTADGLRTPGNHAVSVGDVREHLNGDVRYGDQIVVRLDADDEVVESNENDNVAGEALGVDLDLRSLVTDIQGAASTARVVYAVDSPAAVTGFVIRLGRDVDGDDVIDELLRDVVVSGAETGPGSHVVNVNLADAFLAQQIVSGEHIRIVALLDADDDIIESNESNNRRSTSEQGYVELTIVLESQPDSVTPGQELTAVWRVANEGNIDATDVVLTVPVAEGIEFVRAELALLDAARSEVKMLTAIAQDDLAFIDIGTLAPGEAAQVWVVLAAVAPGDIELWAELSTDTNSVRSASTRVGSSLYGDPNALVIEEITTTTRFVGLCGGMAAPFVGATLLAMLGMRSVCRPPRRARRAASPREPTRPADRP